MSPSASHDLCNDSSIGSDIVVHLLTVYPHEGYNSCRILCCTSTGLPFNTFKHFHLGWCVFLISSGPHHVRFRERSLILATWYPIRPSKSSVTNYHPDMESVPPCVSYHRMILSTSCCVSPNNPSGLTNIRSYHSTVM